MNLISTNCAGSYVMTRNNAPLGNPFAWAFVTYSSVDALMDHFDDIRWSNFIIERNPRAKNTFSLRIDNQLLVHYIHYRLNPKYPTPHIVGHEVESSKIWEYVVNAYIRRTKRMLQLNEPPKFLVMQNNSSGSCQEFIDLYNKYSNCKHKTCWCAWVDTKIPDVPNVIRVQRKDMPIAIVNRFYTTIMQILGS